MVKKEIKNFITNENIEHAPVILYRNEKVFCCIIGSFIIYGVQSFIIWVTNNQWCAKKYDEWLEEATKWTMKI